jgi:hypothetical protein
MEVWAARQAKAAEIQRAAEKRDLECKYADLQRDLLVKAADEKEDIERKHAHLNYQQALRNAASNFFDNIITSKTLQVNYHAGCELKEAGLQSLDNFLKTERGEDEIVAAMENHNFDALVCTFLKGDSLSRLLAEIYSHNRDEITSNDLSDGALQLLGKWKEARGREKRAREENEQGRFKRGRSEFSDDDD